MAEIALPRQRVTQAPQEAAAGSPLYHLRNASNVGTVEMVPNPHFTFPQQYADEPAKPHVAPRPMSLQSYPAGRRGSAPGLRHKSQSTLPDFSFNPAAPAATPADDESPSHSPMDTLPTPSRPIGHRRGGSELIGGNARSGAISMMSTSPTRGDGTLAPPPVPSMRSGPPGGRRGHSHRRSAALSSHDITDIMRSPSMQPQSRAESAPVTPREEDKPVLGHSVNKSVSQPSLRDNAFTEDVNTSPQRPPSRPRVGFASEVEYIRPLSTISSETETSMSTIRGHSTTNSLSSIISGGATTPPRLSRPSVNTAVEKESRPSTAGAILDASPRKNPHFSGDLFTRKRPMSALSPASPSSAPSPNSPREPAKRRSFFRLERRRSDPSVPMLQTSASDPALSTFSDPVPSPSKEEAEVTGFSEKSKSVSRKLGRKPRKVKSWANSIMSRKGKHGVKSKKRAPTPPLGPTDQDDSSGSEDWDFEANFDVDNTVTIVSEQEAAASSPKAETDIASWKPRPLTRVDSETTVIDLDAALGPFNTPTGSGPRVAQRGFAAHRRALHSAGGVPNHRRTESAPELVPFELRTSAVGTTSTMADVFEEEEPEDDTIVVKGPVSPLKSKIEEPKEEEVSEIKPVTPETSQQGPVLSNWNFDDGLGIKHSNSARQEEAPAPLSPLQVPEEVASKRSLEVSPVEVVEDYEEPRTSSLTHSSDSTITPQMNPNPMDTKEHMPVMSLPLPLPQQTLMTPDTFTSSFSSPDFRSSEASFDTPRLGTSTSSMTDYQTLPSPHFGEPGPEMRMSTDVPSLSSSRSTMTSAMHNGFPMLDSRRPSERSTSLCSVPSEVEHRRRKRSSIASLSRLINGSSFAEKSKLSIEQRPQSEYLEPAKELKKKHRRLSKLMFWKPKEGSQA